MEQPKQIGTALAAVLPTSKSSTTCMPTSNNSANLKQLALTRRFGHSDQFLTRVNPETQTAFAKNPRAAIMGDYPTLTDIRETYGPTFPTQWLMPQIVDVSLFVGVKNLDQRQQMQLAQVIATEYHYLKVTELLLFFYRFKTGRYGRFYGAVDPLIVTSALHEFIFERNEMLDRYEQEDLEAREAEERRRNPPMTREEWIEIKTLIAMYNSDYTL